MKNQSFPGHVEYALRGKKAGDPFRAPTVVRQPLREWRVISDNFFAPELCAVSISVSSRERPHVFRFDAAILLFCIGKVGCLHPALLRFLRRKGSKQSMVNFLRGNHVSV